MIWKEVTMKMNFLEKIDRLMFDRGINRHTLAAQSGIPYTTIMGLYTKGYDKVQLSTLKRLCDYFGVSLDYLVTEDIPPAVVITHEEQSLLTTYRTMNSLGQEEVGLPRAEEYTIFLAVTITLRKRRESMPASVGDIFGALGR